MKILFIGDIVGKPGRGLTRTGIASLVDRHGLDLVVANVENAAGGNGITREIGDTIRDHGVDVMTSGNHIWDKREALDYIQLEPRLIRPANFPTGAPGLGHVIVNTRSGDPVAVINVMGRVFMAPLDNPFRVVLEEIAAVRDAARIIIVDFHAEATSEKIAMGWHLDGQVTAVVGTHTHVPTADARLLHWPGAVARLAVGIDRAAMPHRLQRVYAGGDHRPPRHAVDGGDKTDATAVMLGARIVEAEARQPGRLAPPISRELAHGRLSPAPRGRSRDRRAARACTGTQPENGPKRFPSRRPRSAERVRTHPPTGQ